MKRTNKAGWRDIGGKHIYLKSSWEAKYACYLQYLKEQAYIVDWEYEPKDFWFEEIRRGVRSYKPDFYVKTTTGNYWVEVKGYYDAKSLTKIKRFRKYYPNEILKLVDKSWFEKYGGLYAQLTNWEGSKCIAKKGYLK